MSELLTRSYCRLNYTACPVCVNVCVLCVFVHVCMCVSYDFIYIVMVNNLSETVLLTRKIGFPIIKAMSKNLQNFIKEHLSDKITELQQSGGNVEWSDSSVIISGADQSVLDKFDNDVLCSVEERTECLFADQWNKLLHVDFDNTNFLSQLIEDYNSEVKIDLDYENKSITFVGEEQMVLKVKQTLFTEVCQNLPMLG